MLRQLVDFAKPQVYFPLKRIAQFTDLSNITSVKLGLSGTLEEMNATTTSCSPSNRTNAGLNFAEVKFVKGKGIRTILPFKNT